MKHTSLNTFYFVSLTFISLLFVQCLMYEYPTSFYEILDKDEDGLSWKWSNLYPTDRFYNNVKIVLGSVIFHLFVHIVGRKVWKHILVRYYSFPFEVRISFPEKILSSLHGFTLGLAGIKLVFLQVIWYEEIYNIYPAALDYVLCYSCGYEIYDLGVMLMEDWNKPGFNEKVFWIHHTSMLIGYTCVMIKKKMGFPTSVLMVTEMTVIPNNYFWYFDTLNYHDIFAFKFNQVLRVVSFFILRPFTVPFIFIAFCFHWEAFVYQQDLFNQIMAIIIIGALGIMNTIWTYMIIKMLLTGSFATEQPAPAGSPVKKSN